MNMAKLSIKGLIESALNLGRTLDSDYAPLQQFFVVMEHCLKHGLKSKNCICVVFYNSLQFLTVRWERLKCTADIAVRNI